MRVVSRKEAARNWVILLLMVLGAANGIVLSIESWRGSYGDGSFQLDAPEEKHEAYSGEIH